VREGGDAHGVGGMLMIVTAYVMDGPGCSWPASRTG
jgi:hypothetical protein